MLKHLATGIGTFGLVLASIVPVVAAIGDDGSSRNRGFRYYPSFVQQEAVIETAHDKGLMVEFVVSCPVGWGIITLSKVENLYCLPDHSCTGNMRSAIGRLCQ